ncbi:MAG: hypothetical protein JST00_41675 [Deltaproteobacteria bacterium]|nr:hypothetical protein [Deltaproteobacteria bacterium]
MALEGPQVRYARLDDGQPEDALAKALELAREIEELLEDTRSLAGAGPDERASSTRIARAIAVSLVDELEGLTRGARKTGAS